jgi:Tfp pilus assembly protein PilO
VPEFSIKDIPTYARQQPWWLASGGITLVAVVAAVVFWQDIRRLEAEYQERTSEDQSTLAAQFSGSKLKDELARVREAVGRIEENLVIESNLAENHWYFYNLEEQTRSRLVEMHPLSSGPAPAQSPYKNVPYSLKVSGAYEQAAAFLQRLETGPRLVKVTSFSFRRREAGGSAVLLDLNVELLGKK